MPVHARVCFSLEWLAAKLCELLDRTSIAKSFLLEIYTETVHLLECDLNSQTHRTSLNDALACAIEMSGYPTPASNSAQPSDASKTESPTRQAQRPRGPAL